jgi:protein TonB
MKKHRSVLHRYRSLIVTSAVVVVITAVLGYLVFDAIGTPIKASKKIVQQVNIIRAPPPPEPEPPPPEIEEEKLPEPEPEEAADADEPPPGDLLGLDAEGVAGGDAFGLAALKGGRDLLSADDQERFSWYARVMTQEINDQVLDRLSAIQELRRQRYSLLVRIWVAKDGRVERFRLTDSTGDSDLDRNLVAALESFQRVSEAPPDGLPQPVRLRIVSRI